MKNSLCLLVVLALIAQICAIPADHDVKGAADQAASVKDKATKDATDAAKNAIGAADDLKNKGEHGPAGHNSKDYHKPGTHHGPISNIVTGTEELGKKIADASVKRVTDFIKVFGL